MSAPWFRPGATCRLVVSTVLAFSNLGCERSPPPTAASRQQGDAAKAVAPSRSEAVSVGEVVAQDSAQAVPQSAADRRVELFAQHCAGCHNATGDGRGVAATFLYPKPRDFRTGRFRLISGLNGVPTLADLESVIERGMPGSAMISFAHLAAEDRKLLAEQVLELRRAGAADIELAAAKEADEELSPADLRAALDRVMEVGEVLNPPTLPATTPESIARGQQLYTTKGCASCHGKDGKGDGQEKMVDSEGYATRPRDLTRGIFKGQTDVASVYRRLWLGMPGTPMPSSQNLTPEQVGDMVHYVLSLSDEKMREAQVLRRQRLNSAYVQRAPETADDTAWQDANPVALVAFPLWWRDGVDAQLEARALRDDQTLAIRLIWRDATKNDSAVHPDEFEDMVAVQFFQGEREPFLGMGGSPATIDLWLWRAGTHSTGANDSQLDEYPFDTAEYREFAKGKPLPSFVTAAVAGNPVATREREAASLVASGPGSTTFRPRVSQAVRAKSEWNDGRWSVVLLRPLVPADNSGLRLAKGRYSIAFALWDGEAHERGGQKCVTHWNDLVIE